MQPPSARAADAAAAIPAGGWLILHANNLSLYLQWSVALVAIVSGICAAVYHVKAARRLR